MKKNLNVLNEIKIACGGSEIRSIICEFLKTDTKIKSLRLITYRLENIRILNNTLLEDLLSALAKRNVIVSVVIGEMPSRKIKSMLLNLYRSGVKIYYNRRAHLKLILSDMEKEKILLVMTANVTHGGLFYNYEVGILFKPAEDSFYQKIREYTNKIIGSEETTIIDKRFMK